MTMKLKNIIKFYLICIMLAGICFGKEQIAKAADTAYVELKSDTEYSQYDVTGDGKADKVVIKRVKNEEDDLNDYITLKVFINDQIALERKEPYDPYWAVNLIRLKNGKIFFEIKDCYASSRVNTHRLYAYNNGKVKCMYDFKKYYELYAYDYLVNIEKISGNTIETKVDAQFYTSGSIKFNMNVSYKDGKIIRTSNQYDLRYKEMYHKNKWTVNKKIKVYKKAGSKKLAYTLQKRNIIKINKVIYKNNKVYFQVKNKGGKGKTGYIPATKNARATYDNKYKCFKEIEFVG